MTTHRNDEVQLSFEPAAFARCFLTADVLHDAFGVPTMEYALLGLATESNPFHIVEAPLLCGQRVSASTVEQSGYEVLRMRREIDMLSKRMRQRLVPIAFIHRHPSACDASATDDEFLCGVFIDQVTTVVSFEEVRLVDANESHCRCSGMRRRFRESSLASVAGSGPARLQIEVEYGVAFSLIVNRKREHRLYCVRRTTCPFCGRAEVGYIPARLAPDSHCWISALDRACLRRRLENEIRAKVSFEGGSETAKEVR
jgi:hypothetical protein